MIKGIGVDIVSIERFRQVNYDEDYITQILASQEISGIPPNGRREIYIATIFAIKEAVMKALGCGLSYGSFWHDIEVTDYSTIHVSGFLSKLSEERSVIKIHSSISQTKRYVVAIVLLEG